MTASAANQLVFTTPTPSPVTAGQAFTVVVAAKDTFPQCGYFSFQRRRDDGDCPVESGVTDTVQGRTHGVATFVGLKLDTSASGGAILAAGGGLPERGGNQPRNRDHVELGVTPTITGEQVVTMRKKNKKGKPVGKAVLVGFTLDYSTAMNSATAGLAARFYQVTSTSTKHIKKKTVTVHTPVTLTAAVYNLSTNSVTLNIQGIPKFAKGGEITVNYSPSSGVSSEGESAPGRERHRVHHPAECNRH